MKNNSGKIFSDSLFSSLSWQYFVIIIINTLFGLQILSSFFSLLVNFLRERPSVSLSQVAIYAVVTFLLIFPCGFLFRIINKRTLFITLFLSVAAARFIIQACRWAPMSLLVSAIGTILWVVIYKNLLDPPGIKYN